MLKSLACPTLARTHIIDNTQGEQVGHYTTDAFLLQLKVFATFIELENVNLNHRIDYHAHAHFILCYSDLETFW
jgi:hypothetical protein